MKSYTKKSISALRSEFNTTWKHIDRERNRSFQRIKNAITYEVDYREALIQESPDISKFSQTFSASANPYEGLACADINNAIDRYDFIQAGNWAWEDIETVDKVLPSRENLVDSMRAYTAQQHTENPKGMANLYRQYQERLEVDILKDLKANTPTPQPA